MNYTFDKIILVTGGAGFIGSHFLEYMLPRYSNYKFICYDKFTYASNEDFLKELHSKYTNLQILKEDICNYKAIEDAFIRLGITDIIHFAAESHVDNSINDPLLFVRTNVEGTCNLLDVARRYWKDDYRIHRFYHISTDEVYGSLGKNDAPFTEESKYDPHSPYSASKASSDLFVKAYAKTYGMNVVISNCSNNFGTRQHDEKLIPTIIKNLVRGNKVPVYGNGMNERDWLYVIDHVKAIDKIFHYGRNGETYCIGAGKSVPNLDIVKRFCEYWNYGEFDYSFIEFVEDRKGHDFRYEIDSDKLTRELGWVPEGDIFGHEGYELFDYYDKKYDINE